MRVNLPVTQQEFLFPEDELLVSTTDTRGVITHCNPAFVHVSGFSYEELIGQPHNLIRHPDMPAAAYKDMWATIGRGRPWTGLVKNRRKDGSHYWVQANVTPIMSHGKPSGYMSVRIKPSREAVQQAEALYAQMRTEAEQGRATLVLHGGEIRPTGWRGLLARLGRLDLPARLGLMLLFMGLATLLPDALGLVGATAVWARAAILLLAGLGIAAWFRWRITASLDEAVRFAGDLSGCNLSTSVQADHPEPMASLIKRLVQIQVNLRAVVGDVRNEIEGFTQSASEIAQGANDLSARTEAQASALEQTAASMEEISSTVRHTADTSTQVSGESDRSMEMAQKGGVAMQQAAQAIGAIERSSDKVSEIIGVIEGIAFQTNILALNAAVEAARAGEQGRGFAVVASEVRALAQRSANASKEIRELIVGSSQQVHDGARQVQGVGHTIEEVVSSVARVGALVNQISAAAREQSTGLSQINEAVVQLDSATQQNAALVEQSAAAAQSLSSSARSLERSVSVFVMP
ncbi:methyl-accepting chemotaxis protein [Curvibacter sp. HBC61]|uniref:Methyl-accepting chemotaxis protein n=1 Tax=Curvibacter cyanobacteriorum TaxID=3026422 RepID=A0ABT5MYG9_9BURK|nr:PAS domain-containing methyl-accepting chemotaxis protein [Curvibacter sp. HBC61]MDD0838481.1 methyl-accepting chemotaxis protein [Curvibacter sp. HBC61]